MCMYSRGQLQKLNGLKYLQGVQLITCMRGERAAYNNIVPCSIDGCHIKPCDT